MLSTFPICKVTYASKELTKQKSKQVCYPIAGCPSRCDNIAGPWGSWVGFACPMWGVSWGCCCCTRGLFPKFPAVPGAASQGGVCEGGLWEQLPLGGVLRRRGAGLSLLSACALLSEGPLLPHRPPDRVPRGTHPSAGWVQRRDYAVPVVGAAPGWRLGPVSVPVSCVHACAHVRT